MQEPFDIDFRELFSAVKRRWYIAFVLIGVCAFGLTYFKGSGIATYYETSTRIIVGNVSEEDGISYNIQDIKLYESYMNTYVAMLKTDKVIDQTIDALSFNVSSEAIKASLMATPQVDTQFFEITFNWGDKKECVEILTTLTDAFIREMNMIYPDINLHVMDKVDTPKEVVVGRPRRYVFAAGAVMGAVLSLLVIFGLEFLDDTVKGEKDIQVRLKSYLLATIPKQKKREMTIHLKEGKLPLPYFMEAYRRLRTSLSFLSINQEINVISVTSYDKNEGKSTTAMMLAFCMSLSGKKTLLIDCDIRNASLDKYLKTECTQGLVDVLINQTSADQVIHLNVVQDLDFLSAGTSPINPSEILCSERLKKFIEILKGYYDFIIIDTPPIGAVADAQILTQYVDGTILVSAHRKTKLKDLDYAKAQLEYVGGKVLGIVINKKKTEMRKKDYYTYYEKKKYKNKQMINQEG